jgi:phosphate transport system protein
MRTLFHQQLDALTARVASMCGRAGEEMARATEALLSADLSLAEQVISDHEHLTAARAEAENMVMGLLATQAPVARDLRIVFCALQSVADAERMGGLAVHVAEIARRRHPAHAVPKQLEEKVAEMARIAVDLANHARDAVLNGDTEQASRIAREDAVVNLLHRQLWAAPMEDTWTGGVECAVDLTLLSRFYERFADHAVTIGGRVVFNVTGRNPLRSAPAQRGTA